MVRQKLSSVRQILSSAPVPRAAAEEPGPPASSEAKPPNTHAGSRLGPSSHLWVRSKPRLNCVCRNPQAVTRGRLIAN